jgi:hypothetical protein
MPTFRYTSPEPRHYPQVIAVDDAGQPIAFTSIDAELGVEVTAHANPDPHRFVDVDVPAAPPVRKRRRRPPVVITPTPAAPAVVEAPEAGES